jgi:cytochrome c551/c552
MRIWRSWTQRLACFFWQGHEFHTKSAEQRAFLECHRCGKRTVGWTLDVAYQYVEKPVDTMRIAFAEESSIEGPIHRPIELPMTPLRLDFDESSS